MSRCAGCNGRDHREGAGHVYQPVTDFDVMVEQAERRTARRRSAADLADELLEGAGYGDPASLRFE